MKLPGLPSREGEAGAGTGSYPDEMDGEWVTPLLRSRRAPVSGALVFSFCGQWGPLYWARALSLLSLHFYLAAGGLVTRTVRQHLNLNNAEQLCR